LSDDEDVQELMELFDAAEQSDVNPNVYYWDVESAIEEMDGLHQVLFLSEEQRKERGLRPAGHSMEDLQDMPDYVSMEAEYGEVMDRRWIDGLEMDIDTDFGIEFYGGAYLIDDDGLQEYVIVGSKKKEDGTPLGDELTRLPFERYDDLDEVVQDYFSI
jgi:hypothetical protein